MDKYIVKKDVVYEMYSDDLFQGYTRLNPPVIERDPWLCYVGPKIEMLTWRQILAFFKWSFDDSKSETQVRLYFNKEEKLWRAWAFPQEKGTGMTTTEMEDKEGDERQKANLGRGWIEGGTVHHHCSSFAFQSGTDRDNEASKNGLHITVGNIDKFEYSIDGRVSFRGVFYKDVDWSDWFAMPPGLEGLPPSFQLKVMEHFLTRGVTDEDTFPPEWKDNVIKKVYSFRSPIEPWKPGQSSDHWKDKKDEKDAGDHAPKGVAFIPANRQNGATKKALTKKERKLLGKLLMRAELADLPEEQRKFYTEDEEARLQRAALATVQLCASYGMEVSELFACLSREPTHLDKLQANAVNDLEEILEKEDIWPDALEDWLQTVMASGEEPAGGGGA